MTVMESRVDSQNLVGKPKLVSCPFVSSYLRPVRVVVTDNSSSADFLDTLKVLPTRMSVTTMIKRAFRSTDEGISAEYMIINHDYCYYYDCWL